MGNVPGSLPVTQENHTECKPPGINLAQRRLLEAFRGRMNGWDISARLSHLD